jgi:hypothetical protein
MAKEAPAPASASLTAGPDEARPAAGRDSHVGGSPVAESGFGEVDVVELDSVDAANDLLIEPEIPRGSVTTPVLGGNAARSFAMADAIRLLKSLPAGPRAETVVRLVRVTLGEANVRIEDLSVELDWKEKVVEEKIASLQAEADDLEKQLQVKRSELAAQQSEAKELKKVRGRLNMAMSPPTHRPPPIPAAAIKRLAGTGLAVQGT